MYLHLATVKRKNKVYKYAQLVECYRREKDGMPAHRVLANLGALSEQEIANFRLALAASRKGRTVVVPETPKRRPAAHTVLDNLEYLGVAVALAMWREWQLGELVAELVPKGELEVSPSDVVAALTVQRCTAPGSKLYAQRWFPRTALPELLGLPIEQFHNTRVHEVLSLVDNATPELQRRLPQRFVARDGAFTALFVDVTDTWFVGHGPTLAQKGRTKEGMYRRKISVLLMCNQDGFPLRWEVIQGRQHDSKSMSSVLESIKSVSWASKVPIVCDRAMGKTAQLRTMLQTGLHFLTALLRDEYEAYTYNIPHLALKGVEAHAEDAVKQAARAVESAGMARVLDNLYVLDLGIVERAEEAENPTVSSPNVALDKTDKPRQALARVRQIREDLDAGKTSTYRDAGHPFGWSKARVATLMKLLALAHDLQEEIMAGRAAGLSIGCMLRIAAMSDPEQQRIAFDSERAAARKRSKSIAAAKVPKRNKKEMQRRAQSVKSGSVRLRAVVCFNPFQFVDQRRIADRILGEIHNFVRDLNESLASPRSRQTEKSVYAKVESELRRRNLVSAFEIKIHVTRKDKRITVEVSRKKKVWERLRRYDGFNVLVAHPEIMEGAADLARLYRAKNQVEKDFQTIKSVVELRPVHHRTDVKVRAHVTLCMLALLLERTLERKLAQSSAGTMTAKMLFEQLSNVHLNRLQADGSDTPVYTVTRPSREQLALLRALGLQELVEDEEVADQITAR